MRTRRRLVRGLFDLAALTFPADFRARWSESMWQAFSLRYLSRGSRVGRFLRAARGLVLFAVDGVGERVTVVVTRKRESLRSPRRPPVFEPFRSDVRFALRTFRKQPLFALVVTLTVGLGVGANAMMFSVVNGILLDRLPFLDPESLVIVQQTDRFNDTRREGSSLPDYFDYVERQTSFESLAAWMRFNPTAIGEAGEPERLTAALTTHGLFRTLGARAALGRTYGAAEDVPGGPSVAVLSHGVWRGQFGADSSVVGRTITLNERDYEIIGVMESGYGFPSGVDLWLPLQMDRDSRSRGNHSFGVVGRLRDGVTPAAASRDLARIMSQLEEEYPGDNAGRSAWAEPLTDVIVGGVRPALLLLMGAVTLVLLIACANVANILFSRLSHRGREVAIRAAMGAGRGRLLAQLMTESLVLAAAGGLAGVALSWVGIRVLRMLDPAALPRIENVTLDLRVLAFAGLATALAGVLFGVVPALRLSRPELVETLKEGGRGSGGSGSSRLRQGLAVLEMALAVFLVIGAGLLLRSMWTISRVEPGFEPQGLVTLSLQLPSTRYPSPFSEWPDVPVVHNAYSELLTRVNALPSVSSAALALNHPMNTGWTTRIYLPGGPTSVEEGVEEEYIRPVSEGYFATAGIELLSGREFTRLDVGETPRVAVVNEAFVRKYFPGGSALGEVVRFWGADREIVGVVDNVRFAGITAPVEPAVYAPLGQLPFTGFSIVARTDRPEVALRRIRAQVGDFDPLLAVFGSASLESLVREATASQRFNMIMLGSFAGLALLLAAVGVFGVISYGVSQRTQEFGIRMSLGATAGGVVRMVVVEGFRMSLLGIGLGVGAAFLGSGVMAGMLYEVEPVDPLTFGGVAVGLGLVAVAASFIPAIRAARINPVEALKAE